MTSNSMVSNYQTMNRLDYATGYGSRVHILQKVNPKNTLCGARVYSRWADMAEPKPAEVCKSCYKAAQSEGLINFEICPTCHGTGKQRSAVA